MTAPNSHATKPAGPWKATVSDEEIKPKGSDDCARRVVAKLGPFRHQLADDADRLGPQDGWGGRIALSEQLAFERVWMLATSYNSRARLDQNAPRSSDIIEQLNKLETLTGELARFMESLDDITRHRLQTAGTGITDYPRIIENPLMEAADAVGLPLPTGWEKEPETPRWVERLKALSQYANASSSMFLLSKNISDVDRADKGGNTNLYKALYGSASWTLVNEGWYTFDMFNKQATGTEGGPFHLFLMDVFEFATGLDPEEHSKLTYWLKRTSKTNRRYKDIFEKQQALEGPMAEAEELARRGKLEDVKRFQDLQNEFKALEHERFDLWPCLYPFSYPDHQPGS